jgi:hypothetical protein
MYKKRFRFIYFLFDTSINVLFSSSIIKKEAHNFQCILFIAN